MNEEHECVGVEARGLICKHCGWNPNADRCDLCGSNNGNYFTTVMPCEWLVEIPILLINRPGTTTNLCLCCEDEMVDKGILKENETAVNKKSRKLCEDAMKANGRLEEWKLMGNWQRRNCGVCGRHGTEERGYKGTQEKIAAPQ